MRGIYTAAFLDRLVTQFARTRGVESLDLGKGFDLITGTSTGAIVGCALVVGRRMGEIVKMYRDHRHQIFPHRIKGTGSAIWRMFAGGRYVRRGDKVLRQALTDVLKETTMLDVFEKRGLRGISLADLGSGVLRRLRSPLRAPGSALFGSQVGWQIGVLRDPSV